MAKTEQHIWRTTDGRHVPHGHPDAAILAYPAGGEVPDHILDEITGDRTPETVEADPDIAPTTPAYVFDLIDAIDHGGPITFQGHPIPGDVEEYLENIVLRRATEAAAAAESVDPEPEPTTQTSDETPDTPVEDHRPEPEPEKATRPTSTKGRRAPADK
jgi:hypothetical protein